MHDFLLRIPALAVFIVLAGCRSNPVCVKDAEYQTAVNRPRLELPGKLSQSERMAPLVIPSVPVEMQKLDPEPRCLDEPPSYFSRTTAVAASAEDTVREWATAWSERNADAVMLLYSPSFQAPGAAGTAEYLDRRREEIASGPEVSDRIDDVQVTAQGADHRTVAFTQKVDGERVQRELVLVREGGRWRILSEQTTDFR